MVPPRPGVFSFSVTCAGMLLVSGHAVSMVVSMARALLASGMLHPLALFGLTIFVGLGNGLTLPRANADANAGTMSVRPTLAGTAAGLTGAL